MDVNEAYQLVRTDLTAPFLLPADKMARHASKKPTASSWLWAAAAYALEADKTKFTESLQKAAESDSHPHPEAVQVIAQNPDLVYDLIYASARKASLVEAAKWIFAKRLSMLGQIETIIADIEKNGRTLEQTPNSVKLLYGNFFIHVYNLESKTGKKDFEDRIQFLQENCGKHICTPVIISQGKDKQTGNIAWYLAGI